MNTVNARERYKHLTPDELEMLFDSKLERARNAADEMASHRAVENIDGQDYADAREEYDTAQAEAALLLQMLDGPEPS